LDDKMQLVEVQLMESIAYYALSNYPKSRGSLVSARTTANGIYCPPKMQSALDLQSGIMAAQEQDFKTVLHPHPPRIASGIRLRMIPRVCAPTEWSIIS
jgi:hypothetical protein